MKEMSLGSNPFLTRKGVFFACCLQNWKGHIQGQLQQHLLFSNKRNKGQQEKNAKR